MISMIDQPLPRTSSTRTIAMIALAGAATWLTFQIVLWATEPFGYWDVFPERRQELFATFAPVFTAIAIVSTSLRLLTSPKGNHLITPAGGIAMAVSGLSYLSVTVLLPIFTPIFLLVVGAGSGIVAIIQVVRTRSHYSDLLVIPFNVALYLLWQTYIIRWWAVFGD